MSLSTGMTEGQIFREGVEKGLANDVRKVLEMEGK